MPKKKRTVHPRLPNGYGSIRYLGDGRSRPYEVTAPSSERYPDGRYRKGERICYVDDWYVGLAVLNAWHAGTYQPGAELDMTPSKDSSDQIDQLARQMLTDYKAFAGPRSRIRLSPTFDDVFKKWYAEKFGPNAKKVLSDGVRERTRSAYNMYMSMLRDRKIADLRFDDLQSCVDQCPYPSQHLLLITILHGICSYAVRYDIIEKDYSRGVKPKPFTSQHGIPFSSSEIQRIESLADQDPMAEMLLIMIYSGFRISAYKTLEVHLKEGYLKGGVKTDAGKERIVPIHPYIKALIQRRIRRDGCFYKCSCASFGVRLNTWCKTHGFDHTAHDARHTFSSLCERYEVREADRKRMLGHSMKNDITNDVYGHRTLADLQKEIRKIPIPADL